MTDDATATIEALRAENAALREEITGLQSREATLGGESESHPRALAEALEQALSDFVRAVIVADFFAHDEDVFVALHLFAHRLVERFSIADDAHDYSFTT